MSTDKVKVSALKDLPPGGARAVQFGYKEVGVFNVDGKLYAVDNICPHRGGPLSDGRLEGGVVSCPWHGWQFDVTTGALVMSPDTKLARYKVEIEGEDIFLSAEEK